MIGMKRTIVIILSILLIIAIFAYLSVSLAMFKKSTHEEINRLLDEITRQEQIIGLLEQNFRIASRDSAEMRTQLRLPLVKYLFPSQDSGEDETVAESDDTSRFFKALDILIERLETDENRSAADSFFSGRKMQEVLSESELFLKPTKEGYILEHDGHPFYRITIKGRLLYIQDSYQLTEAEKISLTPDAFSEYFKKTYDQVLAESGIRASL